MPTLLDNALLADTLLSLPGWEGGPERIWREIRATPEQLVDLKRAVDVDAGAMGHPPVVEERGGLLRFEVTTPDAGGVTEVDIALASHISDLIYRLTGQQGVDAVRSGAAVAKVRLADDEAPVPGPPREDPEGSPEPTGQEPSAPALIDDDAAVPDPEMPLLEDRP